MAKIDGVPYRLLAVGRRAEVFPAVQALNRSQWRGVDRPTLVIDSEGKGQNYTPQQVAEARATGADVWFSQYRYTWGETDAGAPARIRNATPAQLNAWPELAAYRTPDPANPWQRWEGVALAWEREVMPPAPSEPIVDRKTGEPLADQGVTR